MSKLRVYQLAKDLEVQSALILELLDRMGQDVKSDLSVLDAETVALVRGTVTRAIEVERERLVKKHDAPAPTGDETAVESPAPAEGVAVEASAPAAEMPPASGEPTEAHATVPGEAEKAAAAGSLLPALPGQRKPRIFAARRLVPHPTVRPAPGRGPVTRSSAAPPTGFTPTHRSAGPVAPGAGRTAPPAVRPPAVPPRPAGVSPARPAPPMTDSRLKRRKREMDERVVGPISARPKPDLPPVPKEITLSEAVTVKELAEKLNRKSKDIIAKLMTRGVLANINQPLDPQVAIDISREFGSEASVITFEEEAQRDAAPDPGATPTAEESRPEDLVLRPPVVTVMGHVDHGKTSLLDAIREADVAAGEAGGITQHIGAYQVHKRGRKITFLDTPGHEAFTLMRARGSRVTDIVVLVVAADDGVKPQTVEAIDHAKADEVPIVVAINKIDKANAAVDRVKQQLSEHGVLVEEYGGDTVCCQISARKRQGIDELLEMILLVADLKEFKANPNKPGTGVVLETRLDRARGIVATLLVQDGTLRVGDAFIAGAAYGKVRAMSDEHGQRIQEAGPSMPAELIGFAAEPTAGDAFQTIGDEARARHIAAFRQERLRAESQARSARRTLESLSREVAEGMVKELPIILKTDSQGAAEAIQKSVADIPSDRVRVRVIRSSIGAITRADVLLASASNAVVVGFNVRPDRPTAELARQEEVELRLYSVIYDLLNDMKAAMLGMLEPTLREVILGQAEVRQLFRVPKVGTVAGCYVQDGKVSRSSEVRLIRDGLVSYTGKLASLRRFKDDVSEVTQGYECGMSIAGYNDLKEGDIIESFVTEKIAAESL
jgi:translation initiation factor IF-2